MPLRGGMGGTGKAHRRQVVDVMVVAPRGRRVGRGAMKIKRSIRPLPTRMCLARALPVVVVVTVVVMRAQQRAV